MVAHLEWPDMGQDSRKKPAENRAK